jgi:hypothetical protein
MESRNRSDHNAHERIGLSASALQGGIGKTLMGIFLGKNKAEND